MSGSKWPKYSQIISKQRAKSSVWQYFGYPGDETGKIVVDHISICTLCKMAVSCKATSNLWSHLKIHHPEVYLKESKDVNNMPSFCAVCRNVSNKTECQQKNISFHKFPLNNEYILKKWMARIQREGYIPNKHAQLCSEHFEEDCFTYQNFTNRRQLKVGAVPTKFEQDSSEPKRKRRSILHGLLKKQEIAEKESSPKTSSPEPEILQNKKPKTPPPEPARASPPPIPKPPPVFEHEDYEIGGKRIVDINYFFQQLMQLNKHGPSTCSLNTMTIVSETRRGLATEVKIKCSKCKFEKCIWTEEVSSQFPINLNSAAVTGTIGIRNGLSAMEDFLDVLNVSAVSINTTKNKKVPDLQKAKEEDADGFTIVVKGTWQKKMPKPPPPAASLEKPPEVVPTFRSGQIMELSSEKRTGIVLFSNPVVALELARTPQIQSVTSTDRAVEVNPRTHITPDVDKPDSSVPGQSSRTEQDVMAMTCDNFPAQPDSLSEYKEESMDTDSSDIISATVVQRQPSNESSLTSNQKGSLFHLPVLIKEEPVSFDDET